MRLSVAHVTNYKSIEDSGPVPIEPGITVFVGQNESGKTAFLQALQKAHAVEEGVSYEPVEDYPRKWLSRYEAQHEESPAMVARLEYRLQIDELDVINEDLGMPLLTELSFTVTHRLDNSRSIGMKVDEGPYVEHLLTSPELPESVRKDLSGEVTTLRDLFERLEQSGLDADAESFVRDLREKFPEPASPGWQLLEHYLWRTHIKPVVPQFLYFDDYQVLTGKVNLQLLQERLDAGELSPDDRTVLGLLRLANIDLGLLLEEGGYERARARLEGISNEISDQVFEYWTQNERDGIQELEVQFDIEADPTDEPPFDTGKNLYIRIRSLRHRVSVPFDQRSKGFIWFFSFLVWFDSIKQQIDAERDLILLLDEPGLSLHPLAQGDLLRYVEALSKRHQVLFTTHSPFMIRGEDITRVRYVQDNIKGGTKVSVSPTNVGRRTVFPVRNALGHALTDALASGEARLVVPGAADLLVLQHASTALGSTGRVGLDPEVVVVPAGGLHRLAAAVAMLGTEGTGLAVVQREPVPRGLGGELALFSYADHREEGAETQSAGVWDVLGTELTLILFHAAHEAALGGKVLEANDLAKGSNLRARLAMTITEKKLDIAGVDPYRLASQLPGRALPAKALDRFEAFFKKIRAALR